MKSLLIRVFALLVAIVFSSLCVAIASAQPRETFTGTMIGVGGRLGAVSRTFSLTIEGHTPDAEVSRDVAILSEGGQDDLMSAVRGKRLGRFSLGGQLARDLNFVTETALPTGDRKIMILFERWMNLYELRSGARSTDYPFSYIELIIDRNGRGSGTFIPASRIRFRQNQVEVENFGIYPARLQGVRRRNS